VVVGFVISNVEFMGSADYNLLLANIQTNLILPMLRAVRQVTIYILNNCTKIRYISIQHVVVRLQVSALLAILGRYSTKEIPRALEEIKYKNG
jgi:hypothetical protein